MSYYGETRTVYLHIQADFNYNVKPQGFYTRMALAAELTGALVKHAVAQGHTQVKAHPVRALSVMCSA